MSSDSQTRRTGLSAVWRPCTRAPFSSVFSGLAANALAGGGFAPSPPYRPVPPGGRLSQARLGEHPGCHPGGPQFLMEAEAAMSRRAAPSGCHILPLWPHCRSIIRRRLSSCNTAARTPAAPHPGLNLQETVTACGPQSGAQPRRPFRRTPQARGLGGQGSAAFSSLKKMLLVVTHLHYKIMSI